MSLSSLIEKWDNMAFAGYNSLAFLKYITDYSKYKKVLKRNLELYNLHNGERCFIVLNGPSLNNYDLSKISNEYVITTNHFFKSDYFNLVKPNYHCITDNYFFNIKNNQHSKEDVDKLLSMDKSLKFIFNIKYLNSYNINDNIYLTYSKHMPSIKSIKSNLSGLSSNFISVSMYAMNAAIYMGFNEIYLLGYDFEPGILSHFYKDSESEEKLVEKKKLETNKEDVCGKYWQYAIAQYQNYYMNDHASRNNVKIFNCNRKSNVRSFEFIDYDNIFTE